MQIPFVIEKDGRGERSYDLYSRLLVDRIVFLTGEIDTALANSVIAQLIYLETQDPNKDISLYINSVGGSVTDGLAIYDTMNYIKCDVSTICVGIAASMGAFLLSAGAKGKRYALQNSEIMIHQPLGGAQGQATDVEITANRLKQIKTLMATLLAEHTGQSYEKVISDTERDNYMNAQQAMEYGLIDRVFKKRPE